MERHDLDRWAALALVAALSQSAMAEIVSRNPLPRLYNTFIVSSAKAKLFLSALFAPDLMADLQVRDRLTTMGDSACMLITVLPRFIPPRDRFSKRRLGLCSLSVHCVSFGGRESFFPLLVSSHVSTSH